MTVHRTGNFRRTFFQNILHLHLSSKIFYVFVKQVLTEWVSMNFQLVSEASLDEIFCQLFSEVSWAEQPVIIEGLSAVNT